MLRHALLALATTLCLAACNPAGGVPILLWHSVGEGNAADKYDVPAEEFDRELAILERFGAKTVTLDQVLDAAAGGAPLPERAVVVTFDDGRACLKSAALPVLRKHGMTAEVFVVTSWMADDESHRKVIDDETGRHAYLTWPELREMTASGAFHVQSHSVSHRKVRELGAEELWSELVDSRAAITAHVGVPVNFFAYPFGASSLQAASDVQRAGYRGAVVVEMGMGARYSLKRRSVWKGCEYAVTEALEAAFGAPK
ncbi:MAG TPA: polysaccharide deacetylase family protein [Myxococcales bacterium]|jgi:peptidoglycan/xylan/chitin deacetylase (PgdA/CDA1 family)